MSTCMCLCCSCVAGTPICLCYTFGPRENQSIGHDCITSASSLSPLWLTRLPNHATIHIFRFSHSSCFATLSWGGNKIWLAACFQHPTTLHVDFYEFTRHENCQAWWKTMVYRKQIDLFFLLVRWKMFVLNWEEKSISSNRIIETGRYSSKI